MQDDILAREFFHLVFLRALAGRLAGRPYAVKGGICLRFFHRSPRLSEDMDLDVARIPVSTLAHSVDRILESAAFRARLREGGLSLVNRTAPKQTATTQRWKIEVRTSSGRALSTRLEFSRRPQAIPAVSGIPDDVILSTHLMIPFAAPYYPADEMIRQKVAALASPRRTAPRDLFDLHHLLDQAHEKKPLISPDVLKAAREKLQAISFAAFKAEVLPYLPPDLGDYYNHRDIFSTIVDRLDHYLGDAP